MKKKRKDDGAARRAKARRLHAEISQLLSKKKRAPQKPAAPARAARKPATTAETPAATTAKPAAERPETPRDFIQRRMRETER